METGNQFALSQVYEDETFSMALSRMDERSTNNI